MISMKMTLGLSFFLALLDAGICLQCEICHGIGRSCSGPMKTCSGDGEDTCATILHEVTIGGMVIPSSIKSCLSSNMCQIGPITMNYGKVKARSHLACCTGDDCQTVSISLPPEDNVPNGYQCPACYSVDSFQCGNEVVNCTGFETQCVDLAGLMNSEIQGRVPPMNTRDEPLEYQKIFHVRKFQSLNGCGCQNDVTLPFSNLFPT
ncbi:phospholipase A2 inhibitor gamma subunit B-like isoform X2 [Pogoniulus pusillus]|uniref:phospholipase A2 inhibitor gamma subunit B-like isoform X2 n=1 Tax=Pogoniulus pusillus TaxID=488313 RepID=UPI0030B97763